MKEEIGRSGGLCGRPRTGVSGGEGKQQSDALWVEHIGLGAWGGEGLELRRIM